MPKHSFIQMSKLPNFKGRISYITSYARQENLYATYRTADNQFGSNLAREIRHLQDTVLPKLKQQLADTKRIFKGKVRKTLTEQIQRTEKEIDEKLDKLPDILRENGYPNVQAFMATYRKAKDVVEQYNRDLAAWNRQVRKTKNRRYGTTMRWHT